jgi:hypothetical protein
MSGVERYELIAPLAPMAIEMAAALVLFGISAMASMSMSLSLSLSPNANHRPCSLPPAFSIIGRTAPARSCGFLTMAAMACDVYAAWIRQQLMAGPLPLLAVCQGVSRIDPASMFSPVCRTSKACARCRRTVSGQLRLWKWTSGARTASSSVISRRRWLSTTGSWQRRSPAGHG